VNSLFPLGGGFVLHEQVGIVVRGGALGEFNLECSADGVGRNRKGLLTGV
jgi:hypothetical protein